MTSTEGTSGAPHDIRERLALALQTTDPEILTVAEDCYRGEYPGISEYICHVLDWDIPRYLRWILSHVDTEALRAGYENGRIVVWELRISDDRALIFESLRMGVGPYEVPCGDERITVFARPDPGEE